MDDKTSMFRLFYGRLVEAFENDFQGLRHSGPQNNLNDCTTTQSHALCPTNPNVTQNLAKSTPGFNTYNNNVVI